MMALFPSGLISSMTPLTWKICWFVLPDFSVEKLSDCFPQDTQTAARAITETTLKNFVPNITKELPQQITFGKRSKLSREEREGGEGKLQGRNFAAFGLLRVLRATFSDSSR